MNRLAFEKSPYLLQHAGNPVDWYPWGDEAFRRAREENRPIFLSIGYATCHWCHVMERESFEDAAVAALLNEGFVCIKVDREERPDIDADYMAVCQLLTGGGGWPLTIVMTPERLPFYAGTYIPRQDLGGRSGLLTLLPRIARLWVTDRADLLASADSIREELLGSAEPAAAAGAFDSTDLKRAAEALLDRVDPAAGGFGSAPKFPMPSLYFFLLRAHHRGGVPGASGAVALGLGAMRAGGIFDQLGFGFHRYSTDSRWLVPHFEKMLYDQALLTLVYTEAWQALGDDLYRRTAQEVCSYIGRVLCSSEGAFYSAEDADSEGEEGKFYVWTAARLREALDDSDWESFRARYAPPGESDEASGTLHRRPGRLEPPDALETLLAQERERRAHPFRDDKVLSGWNGLAIAAFAKAGAAFEDELLLDRAVKAAEFLVARMRAADGSLLHRFREGEAAIGAFADDYAYVAWGMLELYEAGFDVRWLREALQLVDILLARFGDEETGGLFLTADDAEQGLTGRQRQGYDGALPSFISVALSVMLRLDSLLGLPALRERAERIIRSQAQRARDNPMANAQLLCALDFALGPTFQLVIAGEPDREDTKAMLRVLRRSFLSNLTVMLRPSGDEPEIARLAPFVRDQIARDGRATAYLCHGGSCGLPMTDVPALCATLGIPGTGRSPAQVAG